jgi:hypothetical protein
MQEKKQRRIIIGKKLLLGILAGSGNWLLWWETLGNNFCSFGDEPFLSWIMRFGWRLSIGEKNVFHRDVMIMTLLFSK